MGDSPHGATGGGDLVIAAPFFVTVPFQEIWCVDFEYQAAAGERPQPLCMVARDLRSGREMRLWRDELIDRKAAPFNTGPESVLVAYYASAEIGCFLELGWPLPMNVVDLFAEHRVETNGTRSICGDSLLGALALRGLAHIDAGEKDAMRRLICDQASWSDVERRAILEYCASDVAGLAALLPAMAPSIDWPRALLRGRYMAAVARMQRAGVPLDGDVLRRILDNWDTLKRELIANVDARYHVYEGTTFKTRRFDRWLAVCGIEWPRLPSGYLALDDDTFRDQARRWPMLAPLRELRASLGALRLTGLEVGADDRNRCLLSPFRSVTGRNQPSTNKFVFGPAKWMRALIRPPVGWGLAYVDFSAQEIGIAAALAGDERMVRAYVSGDPYLAFAKDAGLAPSDATKQSHTAIRDQCKDVVLGVNYGMGPDAMATKAGITPAEAKELLRLHRNTYRKFWSWSEATVDQAILSNEIRTVFGWRCRVRREPNPRALMNFPMQANGAEMMRVAAIAATEAGIEVCAPVHDAFLIAAPLDRLDEDVAAMQELMTKAGRTVTGGLDIRTEANVVRWPDRYMDPRGEAMWARIVALLSRIKG
jgi:DNA polymerase-1